MESNGGGREVRRVNLVYFLSHSGQVDHPHLLRVHHLSRNGVFLRDVKRWLADTRGDAMPNTFCWSCKRRYKNGYVWQDLLDDDLITPISDNEYVLKGSEILQNSSKEDPKACGTSDGGKLQNPKLSSEMIRKESPIFCSQGSTATNSTVTEESTTKDEEETILLKKPDRKKVSRGNGSGNDIESGRPSVSSTTSSSSSSYIKSNARASHMLRNLMKCGGLDANDAVLVPLSKSSSGSFGAAWEAEHRFQYQQHNARKSLEEAWSGMKIKETMEFCKPKMASSKTSIAPLCSQCGKFFKPDKMHSHMKLCRGKKNSSTKNVPVNSLGHQRVVKPTLLRD